MSRTDAHLEGMLRHLGAAYYDSLHGRASQDDVTRAVNAVTEQLNEDAQPAADGVAGSEEALSTSSTGSASPSPLHSAPPTQQA